VCNGKSSIRALRFSIDIITSTGKIKHKSLYCFTLGDEERNKEQRHMGELVHNTKTDENNLRRLDIVHQNNGNNSKGCFYETFKYTHTCPLHTFF
jgi:hypothetical protein